MAGYEVIFDVLKKTRIHAEKYNLSAVLDAVRHAENLALLEICRVDFENHGTGYHDLLESFSPIRQEVKH